MGWSQTDLVQQKRRCIDLWLSGSYTKTELATLLDVSRVSVYECINHFKEGGYEGLEPRSHAPKSCPHRTDAALEQLIVELRCAHPGWGPLQIRQRLALDPAAYGVSPGQRLPAASTIGAILVRNGRIPPKPKRPKLGGLPRERAIVAAEPNAVWTIDFKGEFRLGDRRYCYPLTLQDAFSRYLLGIGAEQSCHGAPVRAQLERAFGCYGLPAIIHSDNGNPFASMGRWRLSRLSVWWIELGIVHQLSRPRCPQDNPRHERMHKTLKEQTARPPRANLLQQQERFEEFRQEFNQQRPHQGLDGKTPAMLYHASVRALPSRIAPPEYAGHCEVRRVHNGGEIRFKGGLLFISQTLGGKRIALEEIDDGIWQIWYYQTPLGRYNERTASVQ